MGAYAYKESDDLLRFKVKPTTTKENTETFTIQFANTTTQAADLHLMWEKTDVAIHMNTDDDAQVMLNIDTLMQKAPNDNAFNAIQYYYENNKDMNKALTWALNAQKSDPKAPYYVLWEARVRLKMGDKQGAAVAAQRGVDLAKAAKFDEYVHLNQAVLDMAKK